MIIVEKNIIQRTQHLEVGHLTHGLTWKLCDTVENG